METDNGGTALKEGVLNGPRVHCENSCGVTSPEPFFPHPRPPQEAYGEHPERAHSGTARAS